MLALTYALTGIFAVVAWAYYTAAYRAFKAARGTARPVEPVEPVNAETAPDVVEDSAATKQPVFVTAEALTPRQVVEQALVFATAALLGAIFCGWNATVWHDADDAETITRLEQHYGFTINEPGSLRTKEVTQWQINGAWQSCYLDTLDMTVAELWCKDTRRSERGTSQYGDYVSAINFG